MQTLDILRKRHSARAFDSKPVGRQLVEQIIDCARFAPTARNVQPWDFIVVRDSDMLNKLAGLIENARFISACPCCIAVFCKDTKYYLEDGCAATENIIIAATDLGLGSCWIAGDKKPYCEEIRLLLGAPIGHKLVSLVALGYYRIITMDVLSKRSLSEVLHWDKF